MQSKSVIQNSLVTLTKAKGYLASFDRKKLITASAALALAISLVSVVLFVSSRPVNEVLYAGLTRQDSGRVATALRDAGIEFDLNTEGSTVYVRHGHAPRARMLLAQKGLPHSNTAGYELFEKLGTFGLTSFMQEVTKIRAIEGELSRTIQMVDGIRSARVHLVVPERTARRPQTHEPAASIVLQTDLAANQVPVPAIRHLVSAAVPGLKPRNVTITGHDGTLLASPLDEEKTNTEGTKNLEKEIGLLIQRNIMTALVPYVTAQNIRVSVSVAANTDKKETTERLFLPDTKVERSVRTTRESSDLQQGARENPVSAQQNIPRTDQAPQEERRKQEASQRREELTNYEISTRATNTTSGGYSIERLSVAISINKAALMSTPEISGSEEQLGKFMNELEQLAKAAAGLKADRGDTIKMVALQYLSETGPSANSQGYIWEKISKVIELVIRDIILAVVILLILYFGVRPLLRGVFESRSARDQASLALEQPDTPKPGEALSTLPAPQFAPLKITPIDQLNAAKIVLIENLKNRQTESTEILKQWLRKTS